MLPTVSDDESEAVSFEKEPSIIEQKACRDTWGGGLDGYLKWFADGADVSHKDRAARLWCENSTRLTKQRWSYVKVPQAGFENLEPSQFSDLVVFESTED